MNSCDQHRQCSRPQLPPLAGERDIEPGTRYRSYQIVTLHTGCSQVGRVEASQKENVACWLGEEEKVASMASEKGARGQEPGEWALGRSQAPPVLYRKSSHDSVFPSMQQTHRARTMSSAVHLANIYFVIPTSQVLPLTLTSHR